MIGLTNMDPAPTDAGNRAAMLEAGVTQARVTAQTQAARKAGADAKAASLDGTSMGANPRISLNPLQVGPVSAPNYIQPNTGSPAAGAATVQVENNKNPLGINAPVAKYTQPGTGNPAPPASGQLGTLVGCLGVSKVTLPDGTTRST